MTHPPEAWYADPADPAQLRWWDGRQWTGHTAPMRPAPASVTPPMPISPAPYAPYPASAGQAATYAATYVTAHATYRPARGLARASIVLAVLILVTELVLTVVSVPSYNRISDATSQGRNGDDVFTPYDGVALLQFLVEIAAYVVSCLWLWRVRGNAEALNPAARHVRRRGWVWGGWICPVVNWWFPYQVVRDVARATGGARDRVGSWWTWFVIWSLVGNLISRLAADGVFPVFQAVSVVAAIVAGAKWIGLVRAISRDQREDAAAHGAGTV